MSTVINDILEIEKKAELLFEEIELSGLIFPGKQESQLNEEIFELAFQLFGIESRWQKRIVRTGKNTLEPYTERLQNLYLEPDDILTINLCPVFDGWEGESAKTYVLGSDPYKLKLKHDIEVAWQHTKAFFDNHTSITGSELYRYTLYLAKKYGWALGGEISGHVAGQLPEGRLGSEYLGNIIHPDNHTDMLLPDINGHKRDWLLEIHFIDRLKQIGGFTKQLLTVEHY